MIHQCLRQTRDWLQALRPARPLVIHAVRPVHHTAHTALHAVRDPALYAVVSLVLCPLLCLIPRLAPAAWPGILLNEYQSSNLTSIADEDEDYSDWIELYNSGPDTVDLGGCGLSDDEDAPLKWVFPGLSLPPQAYLLIYASDKDRRAWAEHWETIIDWGHVWKYRVNESAPPPDWRELGFDDSAWREGPSGFGHGDGDDSTCVPVCISVSIRKAFSVEDPSTIRHLCLHVDYDDAFVAWLNGVEIARGNIYSPGAPSWDQPADGNHEARIYRGRQPETYAVIDATSLFQAGPNVLAVEVHNLTATNGDMSLIPFLTLGLNEAPPGGGAGVPDLIRFITPQLHTNFKLDAAGEILSLHSAQGDSLDEVATGQMYVDLSRGRMPDGGLEWFFFTEPTPWDPNGGEGLAEFAAPPEFSTPGGFYEGAFTLELSSPSPDAAITYTLDGSDPADTSSLYAAPIPISRTTVVRARAFEAGHLPSRIVTHSYFLQETTTLPVISLVTDPPNLWDDEIGIYVLGSGAAQVYPYYGANFWQDWERPIHVEFFEPDGAPGFRLDAGVKIHGGLTRALPQKSLRLITRGGYGTPSIGYRIFGEKEIDSFKRIVLRNAGNDWCKAHLRDALQHRLAAHTGLDRQAHRPSRVYLNGEYWGIHNIREKIGRYYLESNHGVDPDNVDLLRDNVKIVEGGAEHYRAMLEFIEQNGLSDDENFAYIQTQMDTDNFATYFLFRIFYANTDWPGGNIRYWRPRTPDGRWRWILVDTDWGLGLEASYTHNTLAFALEPNGPEWPNPPWSTFLLRSLMENEGFTYSFINRYADHLNSSFLPARTTAMAANVAGLIEEEIPRHMERWDHPLQDWAEEMGTIIEFLQARPVHARGHVMLEFGLSGTLALSLDIIPPGGGSIELTAISIASPWSGIYFRDVPIRLTAVPAPGYVFAEWSDPGLPQEPTIEILPQGNYDVAAIFVEAPVPDTAVVINEINYKSADDFDPGDWVELHNCCTLQVDLSGWVFKDENDEHAFTIPDSTVLAAGGYLVLCQNLSDFSALFPEVNPVLGDLGFGFSGGGELLRLFDAGTELYDWVEYDDDPPWPPEPDGEGPTLELIDPGLDNTLPESWAASADHGTPGAINSVTPPSAAPGADEMALTVTLGLERPLPNPTHPGGRIRFSLDRTRRVSLEVYDICGRRVATLARGGFAKGAHQLTWTGLDDAGHPVSSGLYLLRMNSEGFGVTRRLLVLR